MGPVELDLIESYAQGKVSRRNFVKRGTIIGLSAPFMGAIIAACGSDGDTSSPATPASGDDGATDGSAATTAPPPTGGAGGNLIVAYPGRRRQLRPRSGGDARPRHLLRDLAVLRVPRWPRIRRQHCRHRAGQQLEPQRRRFGVDLRIARRPGMDRRFAGYLRRRCRHHGSSCGVRQRWPGRCDRHRFG